LKQEKLEMQPTLRIVFALLGLVILTNGAYAADPATSPESESQAIQGEESGPASATGAGPTAGSDPAMESKAIEGKESGPASKQGEGPTAGSDPAMESKEIEGQ
jgi:hypothetical protein